MKRQILAAVVAAVLIADWQMAAAQTQTGQTQKPKTTPPAAPKKPGTAAAPAAPATKPASQKPAAQKPAAPETPEKALARMGDACSAGDFKACADLRDSLAGKSDAIPAAAGAPKSIAFKGAAPALAIGTVWTYRSGSTDPAFDNKLVEITLTTISPQAATFTARIDGVETNLKVDRSTGAYFSPHVTPGGIFGIVAERVPDGLSEGTTWRMSPSRRFHYDAAGNRIGETLEGEAVQVTGPVVHTVLGKAWPGVRVMRGDHRLVVCADVAFASQALIATPKRARVLFNLASLKESGATEQAAPPAIDAATWGRLERWIGDHVASADFGRVLVEALVAHVNERPKAQFVMIGGTSLMKSGKGGCVVWGHKGLVTGLCDAEALGVTPLKSQLFIVP
jgi:hypothetical protein